YAISGLLAGVGGVLLTSRLGAGIPTAGTGFELQAIAACVIGGASLSGARGSAIGAACGAVIIGVLNNGGNLLAINSFYLQIAIGVLILVAVGFDQMDTRRSAQTGRTSQIADHAAQAPPVPSRPRAQQRRAMHNPPILTARDAADLIDDGDVITVNSSSGLGCPDAVLAGIGQRFSETQSPTRLTSVHPIAAGDMWGIKGIDHLAHPGLLTRVIAGSYPSGPSSAEPPLIWQMIENNEVEAYNFPSGVLYQLHRAAAAKQPGVLSAVGVDTFVDPRISGGRMNETTPKDLVRVHSLDGKEWLFYDAVVPDVAIIRATTADANGNLMFEVEASPLGALDLAYAAHNNGGIVIAQVKRLAEGGSLAPQSVRVPGILVDALVLAPEQLQTTHTFYDPAISGQLRRPLKTLEPVPFTLEKVMARRAAAELQAGEIANLGFGVSALVPHVLVEEGLASAVSWVI